MAKIVFQDEQGQNLNRYKIIPVEGQPNVVDLERMAIITKQGTPYSKAILDRLTQDEDLAAHTSNATIHANQAEKDTLATAVQSATVGGAPVVKVGAELQLPAYPTSLPANGGTSTDTTSISSSLTLSTAAPTATLAPGKLWGVY